MTRLATVKAERDAAQQRSQLYLLAITLIDRRQPDAIERVQLGDDQYVLSVYAAMSAHGGVMIQRFAHPGQADSLSVEYFDSWRSAVRSRVGLSADCTAFAVAADRLTLQLQERRV